MAETDRERRAREREERYQKRVAEDKERRRLEKEKAQQEAQQQAQEAEELRRAYRETYTPSEIERQYLEQEGFQFINEITLTDEELTSYLQSMQNTLAPLKERLEREEQERRQLELLEQEKARVEREEAQKRRNELTAQYEKELKAHQDSIHWKQPFGWWVSLREFLQPYYVPHPRYVSKYRTHSIPEPEKPVF